MYSKDVQPIHHHTDASKSGIEINAAINHSTPPETPMPEGKLLSALRDNIEHVFQPTGPIHQFVKNSINSYPSVGDLMPSLA